MKDILQSRLNVVPKCAFCGVENVNIQIVYKYNANKSSGDATVHRVVNSVSHEVH
jgi:hypothetical protein